MNEPGAAQVPPRPTQPRRPPRHPSRSRPELREVLTPFRPEHGPEVIGWLRSVDEAEDRDLDEAELARLVIAPAFLGKGHGRALTRALADEAHRRGFSEVWLRLVPENAAARRAHEAAGFERATADHEGEFNRGQPRTYVWMRDASRT